MKSYIYLLAILILRINELNGIAVRQVPEGSRVNVKCDPSSNVQSVPATYEWYDSNNRLLATNEKLVINRFEAKDQGIYTCKAYQIIDGRRISNQQSVRLELANSGGTFQVNVPSSLTTTVGGMIFIKCDTNPPSTSSNEYIFEWVAPNGQRVVGRQFFSPNVHPSNAGRYTCRVTKLSTGDRSQGFVDVVVNDAPVQVSIVTGTPSLGTTIQISCNVDKSTSPGAEFVRYSYQWLAPNGQTISNSETASVTINTMSDFGQYTCLVTPDLVKPSYVQRKVLNIQTRTNPIPPTMNFIVTVTLRPPQPILNQALTITCATNNLLRSATYQILYNGVVVTNSPIYVIPVLTKSNLGDYTCKVSGYDPSTGSPVQISSVTRVEVSNKTPSTGTRIEMEITPGPTMIANINDRRELHCEVRDVGMNYRGTDVKWYFEGRELITFLLDQYRLSINPRMFVSILVLKKVGMDNQGKYTCRIGNVEKEATLRVLRPNKQIEVNPPEETRKVGDNIPVEFHCQIEGYSSLNTDVLWSFRSTSTGQLVPLDTRRWNRNDRPTTDKSSFITLMDVQLTDDGTYICTEPTTRDTASARLIVRDDVKIYITPPSQTRRIGQTAEVQCYITNAGSSSAYPEIFFENGLSVTTDPRVRITQLGNGRIQYTMTGLRNEDNNMKLLCRYQSKTAYATINVERVCTAGYRLCRNGQCINAAKFCDQRQDCTDGSDEDPKYCNKCDPLTKKCELNGGRSPLVSTYQIHWKCDGEDDCGNGYDEAQCFGNVLQCGGLTYSCQFTGNRIARSFICDGDRDCPQGDDETACSVPTIIAENNDAYTQNIRRGTTVTLTCRATGKPLPTIIWRFNWGCLPDSNRMIVSERYESDCSMTVSTLTITDFQPGDDGIYNCEALSSNKRAWSRDYQLLVNFSN